MSVMPWVLFNALILGLLAVDLRMHREEHERPLRAEAGWTALWIGVALLFWLFMHEMRGPDAGAEFLAAYLIEKALSVDNLFVFTLIFSAFGVPPHLQRRVLFWGILGALVMRGTMIGAGIFLVSRLDWMLYVFGVMLVLTGLRMCRRRAAPRSGENAVIRIARRVLPITPTFVGSKFFAHGAVTPLFLTLIAVETSDVLFALDSVPAVFAVTTDPFIVFTSNALAILGLRSLYFFLAGSMRRLRHLETGLAVLLIVIGSKMLLADVVHLAPFTSLLLIALVLFTSVIASLTPLRRRQGRAVGPLAAFFAAFK